MVFFKKLAKWFVDFIGGTAAIIGAAIIGMQGVELFYFISGRIQDGEKHTHIDEVAMLIIGILLLVVGYNAPKYLAAKLEFNNNDRKSQL